MISPSFTTASEASRPGSRKASSGTSESPPTRSILPSKPYPVPLTVCRRPGMLSSTAVISFRVRVPVLSELMAEVEPRVSTERSCFTIACALARVWLP